VQKSANLVAEREVGRRPLQVHADRVNLVS
jgi:hypothetical protein